MLRQAIIGGQALECGRLDIHASCERYERPAGKYIAVHAVADKDIEEEYLLETVTIESC